MQNLHFHKHFTQQASTLKESNVEVIQDEVSSEKTSPSQGTDECPTVVVTAITAGDTPTSDEEPPEIKEESAKEEPAKKEPAKEEPPQENPDAFECSFDDNFANFGDLPIVPSEDSKSGSEPVKMETGSDTSKGSFEDSKGAETTG